MSEPIDSAVLLRFIGGTASAAERAAVEQWIAADPSHREEVARLTRTWELAAEPREPAWDTKALWRRIESQLHSPSTKIDTSAPARSRHSQTRPLVLIPSQPRSRWATTLTRLAAAAAIVAGIATTSRLWMGPEPGEHDTIPSMRTVATKRGERAELRLADGTKVVLGAASTLRIPSTYGSPVRDLYLDGEAYFEVTHDESRPMRVHTARTMAEDLGTRFVVNAYDSQTTDHVAVAEGIVALRGGTTTDPVVLHARDVGRVSVGGAVKAVRGVSVDRYFSWIDGVIQFDDELVADAIPVLERQYDIDIRVTSASLARRRFTGSFRAGDVDEFLKGLAFLLDANYERRGRDVKLTPRR
jgi:ferric-dicitrate binding protein FerR (iron transport regulator)